MLTGPAAARYAGPGVVYSFIMAAVGCVFAGLCYAEFAAMIPVAGSAYTYGYATLGEIFAWIIGWDLVLEYAFGAATVCSGWSGYVLSLGQDFGMRLPPELAGTPGSTFVLWHGHWEFLGRVAGKLMELHIDPATLPQQAWRVQPGRVSSGSCGDDDPGHRHQGVGELQQRYRGREGRRAADLPRASADQTLLHSSGAADA